MFVQGLGLALAIQAAAGQADAPAPPTDAAHAKARESASAPGPSEVTRAVRPLNPQAWVNSSDYPVAAIRGGMTGIVGFTLSVSEAGSVTACRVTRTSGWPLLDQDTCDLLIARARFEPAIGKNNRPVPSQFSSRFQWDLPSSAASSGGDQPPVPVGSPASWFNSDDYPGVSAFVGQAGTTEFKLDINETGTPVACHVLDTSGYWWLDEAACRGMSKRARFSPARDSAGNAVKSSFQSRVKFALWSSNPGRDPKVPPAQLSVPVDAIPAGASDNALLRVHFPDLGKADACRPERSSGSRALDQQACRQAVEQVHRPPMSRREGPPWNARMVEVRFIPATGP